MRSEASGSEESAKAMARVLIIDDQEAVAKALQLLLEVHDLDAVMAATPAAALEALERESIDVVIQDMNFGPGEQSGDEGVALFRSIHRRRPELPVLLITAFASLETAVQLIKEGATDYLAKPWDDRKLVTSIRNLVRLRQLERENLDLRHDRVRARGELAGRYDLCGLIYASDAMHDAVSLAVRVARADVPILITGPNGTGKEKIAEVIVANSSRRERPFVRVNVGALPSSLLEAELFGAEAGAFTGATRRREGRFEVADGGTLLLDEVGTLPTAGQTRLLRVLQTGQFERLGSSRTQSVDVRVIAATNADLRRLIADGEFREDLYFRLNVVEIEVPSLAKRSDDILPLCEHFLAQIASSDGVDRPLAASSRAALLEHSWPGNVRELRNCVQRARLVATGARIEPSDLALGEPTRVTAGSTEATAQDCDERARITQVLEREDGVHARAAAALGMSRQALYRRMRRLGIVVERRLKS